MLAGAGYGVAVSAVVAPAALSAPGFAVRQASLIALAVALATVAAVAVTAWAPGRAWVSRLARGALRWHVPDVAAGLVAAVLIAFLIRPSVQTAHWNPGAGTAGYVGALQKLLGLPVQPTRSYAEDSLYWVIWYIGIPALLLGGFGMALLARRCVRALLRWADDGGVAWAWGLPLAIFAWTTVIVLWDPHTVPDQPWASQTLVPVVLPGFILCGIWVAAWLDRRARERGAGRVAVALAAAFFVLAMAVPTVVTTLGISLSRTATGHSGPTATGVGVTRTGAGQAAAVQELCGAMSARMSVVILDRVAASEFAQAIRGMCGVPGRRDGRGPGGAGPVGDPGYRGHRPRAGPGGHPRRRARSVRGDPAPGGRPGHHAGRARSDPAALHHLADQLPALDVGAEHLGTAGLAGRRPPRGPAARRSAGPG